MSIPMDAIPAVVQSGEDLADDFVNLMNKSRAEYIEPIKVLIRTLDAEALRTYASRVMDGDCTKIYPIAAGTFNIVYFLGFRDGREAIARVNKEEQTSDQTLLRDRLLSEASTLRYIKTRLSVPVPMIYSVNDQLPNPVGGRFMIQERVLGRQVHFRQCTPDQRKAILTQVFRYEAELMSARFNAIGSIYHRAEDNTFYVGPMGPSVCRPLNHTIDRGPWTSTRDWLKAYVKSELAGIQDSPEKYRKTRNEYRLDNGNPPFAYHVAWLKTLLATIDELEYLRSIPAEVERPVLFHEDLSTGNILLSYPDPSKLVGIIDFEGARVIPLWGAMDDPICCMGLDDTDSLLELRLEILCRADLACTQAQSFIKPLRLLRWLACAGITIWCSTERLHEKYKSMKEAWPVHEPAFTVLDELVALGPSGYLSRE